MGMQVVAGGGAVEAALSVSLEYLATALGSREQLAIAEFAESLLIIPKVHFTSHLNAYCQKVKERDEVKIIEVHSSKARK